MKTRNLILCQLIALVWVAVAVAVARAGVPFSYQGFLEDNGLPANGLYDFRFGLYNTLSNPIPFGQIVTKVDVPVSDGLFNTELDLNELSPQPDPPGSPPLVMVDDDVIWIEIEVRLAGSADPFLLIGPRQAMNFAPRAAYARMAATALTVPAGAIASSNLAPATAVLGLNGLRDEVQLLGGEGIIVTTNAGLKAGGPGEKGIVISASRNCADYANCYWALLGNVVDGSQWLGTINNFPLNVRVNSATALRIVPTAGTANLVGGDGNNAVLAGVVGATIGGGGTAGSPNVVNADYGTVSGGAANTISEQAVYATISGGRSNVIAQDALDSTIGGGIGNRMDITCDHGTIGGGFWNFLGDHSRYSTIAGGSSNFIGRLAPGCAIGGGDHNTISNYSRSCVVAGGEYNFILSNSTNSAIGGGNQNWIKDGSFGSTVGGGQFNVINSNANHGAIGGGYQNTVQTDADYATVGGGQQNTAGAWWSTVAGGVNNWAGGTASSVGGGNLNSATGGGATIAGGDFNSATGWRAAVGGGANNSNRADHATIPGGSGNVVQSGANYAAIGGGNQNQIPSTGASATIAGGWMNNNAANAAAIGGGDANVITSGASYATIAGGRYNNIPAAGQFATVPGGLQAKAATYGQMAYASGAFASAGDAQSSLFVARRVTTTNTPAELFLDGTGQRMSVPAGATWTFDILVVGRTVGGATSAGYQIRGVIENNAGTITVVRTVTAITEDDATWNADVDPTDSNTYDALVIKVTGALAATVRWVASVRTAEVDVD